MSGDTATAKQKIINSQTIQQIPQKKQNKHIININIWQLAN
jgi:hypothetical protein